MEQEYYLQDTRSYVGNAPLWHAIGYAGYTTDIDKAQILTKTEAIKAYKSRMTDIPWKKKDVDKAIRKTVDAQFLKQTNDDDFYKNLENYIKEKKECLKKESEKYQLEDYKNNELSSFRDYIDFDSIKDFQDFDKEFDKYKEDGKNDYHQHYYPISYNKTNKEVFDDLFRFGFLKTCNQCKKIIDIYYFEDDQLICDDCFVENEECD